MDIAGMAAVVSGGASGLGAATAAALARAGAKVSVLDLDADRAEATAATFGGQGIRCNVTDALSTEMAFAAARQAHGPARIAVSCAGVAPAGKIVGREGPMALDTWAKTIQINLIGTFNILRLAAADMVAQAPLANGERGVVVNTASIAAWDGQIGQTAYAASKAGVAGLTLPAARELARDGIRVLAIAPGIFKTPMLEGLPEEVQSSLGAQVPFPSRLGDPAEFAALALHMIGNTMMNGETVRLDGALRMAPR